MPSGAILDASTFALYRLDEASASSDAVDLTGNYTLTHNGSPTVAVYPKARLNGGRECTTTNQGFSKTITQTNALFLAGEWTLEGWVYFNGTAGRYMFPFEVIASGGGHTMAYIDITPTDSGSPGQVRSYWNAGPNATVVTSAASATNLLVANRLTHIAIRHRLSSGSRYVDFFKDGVLITTSGALTPPSTTYAGTPSIYLARDIVTTPWISDGAHDDFRISTVARSDAEILATYNNARESDSTGVFFTNRLGPSTNMSLTDCYNTITDSMRRVGWTLVGTPGTQNANYRTEVYKSIERTTGVGDCLFMAIKYYNDGGNLSTYGTRIGFICYSDYDTTAQVGFNGCAVTSASIVYVWNNPSFSPFNTITFRVNPWSIAFQNYGGFVDHSMGYFGFLQRQVPADVDGVSKLSAGIAIGTTVLPVTLPNCYIGQKLLIVNRGGNNASANKNNVEQVTVTALSPLTTTATLKAFDINSIVGENVYPAVSYSHRGGFGYACFGSDGARESVDNGTRVVLYIASGSLVGASFHLGAATSADTSVVGNTSTGRRSTGQPRLFYQYLVGGSVSAGELGAMYNMLVAASPIGTTFADYDDVLTGDRYWSMSWDGSGGAQIVTTGGVMLLGPGAPQSGYAASQKIIVGDNVDTDSGTFLIDGPPIVFSAKKEGAYVRVDFGQTLRTLAATTVAANYTFTGPDTLTATAITFTPGDSFLLISVAEDFTTGTYTLTIAADTVETEDYDTFNLLDSSDFDIESAGGGLTIDSVIATLNTITITFSDAPTVIDVAALDRTRWSAHTGGQYIVINSVTQAGNTVILSTTEMANGSSYTLEIPNTTIAGPSGSVFLGPFTQAFTGFGVSPTIAITQVIDARTIDVIFSERVNKYDALNETNYTINNGLSVVSVAQLSTTIFRLTTSKQTVGTSYTVTASNIRDDQGNLT